VSEFTPRKATKSRVKLKMAIQGPSGSGKTEGALALAKHLVPEGRILLIDTENESASLYANRYDFDTIPLNAPYTSERYKQAMQVAAAQKYDVLIVDSLSQQWDGEGGILRRKEALDRTPNSNSFTNWAKFTPEHTAFVEFIKQIPVHTIATVRTKQDYVIEENDRGKKTPRKIGMAPIQRDGMEYEFTLVFDVSMGHLAMPSKNRTTLFGDGDAVDLTDPKVAISIRQWLEDGEHAPERSAVSATPAPLSASVTRGEARSWKYESGMLLCVPPDVQKRMSKDGKNEFVAVKLNGQCEGKNTAFCWHASLFDLLLSAKGQPIQLSVELSGEYLNVTDLLAIGSQEYRDGDPYPPPAKPHYNNPEITDDDIPF
jgi:energy-coupling factor transporter ATP-binding protein EcfA2